MKTRTILLLVLLLAGAAGFIAYRMYDARTPKAAEQTAEATIDAKALYDAFVADEAAAGAAYNDKVVQVSGMVREMSTEADGRTNVLLETDDALGAVVCEFAVGDAPAVGKDDNITVKGFCAGYNMDVLLQRCAMVQ